MNAKIGKSITSTVKKDRNVNYHSEKALTINQTIKGKFSRSLYVGNKMEYLSFLSAMLKVTWQGKPLSSSERRCQQVRNAYARIFRKIFHALVRSLSVLQQNKAQYSLNELPFLATLLKKVYSNLNRQMVFDTLFYARRTIWKFHIKFFSDSRSK